MLEGLVTRVTFIPWYRSQDLANVAREMYGMFRSRINATGLDGERYARERNRMVRVPEARSAL